MKITATTVGAAYNTGVAVRKGIASLLVAGMVEPWESRVQKEL